MSSLRIKFIAEYVFFTISLGIFFVPLPSSSDSSYFFNLYQFAFCGVFFILSRMVRNFELRYGIFLSIFETASFLSVAYLAHLVMVKHIALSGAN